MALTVCVERRTWHSTHATIHQSVQIQWCFASPSPFIFPSFVVFLSFLFFSSDLQSARDLQTMPAHRDTFSDGCASTYGAEEVAVAAVACVRCPEGIFLEALTAAVEVVDVNDRVWDAALKAWEAWRLRSIL